MVGVARPNTLLLAPRAVGRPSLQPNNGLWHPAHDKFPSADSLGSKNSILPSAIRSGVSSLPGGYGVCAGSSQTISALVGAELVSSAITSCTFNNAINDSSNEPNMHFMATSFF